MPTTYAHDLFGKRVYRRLPDKLQHLIRSNGNLYRIGQHGPDILREKDPELMAYMLGFGCHYILDSTCHPYVNQVAKEGKVSHTLLEKELDRMLMYETGKNPLRFYPSHGIKAKYMAARTIHKVLPAFITEFFMSQEPEVDCHEELLKLDRLIDEALGKAPDMLEELAALAVRPGHLSDRWNLTFNG